MCGRFALIDTQKEVLQNRFNLDDSIISLKPNYNIAPSQFTPIITMDNPKHITMARFGFIPFWAKEDKIGYKMINARGETIMEKRTYKKAFEEHRCLIPANCFYEWKKEKDGKHPYLIQRKDKKLFTFAGITSKWEDPKSKKEIYSFSIITISPNILMKPIHDRMPVILPKDKEREWLSDESLANLQKLLKPYPKTDMNAIEISTLVNSPKNNSKEVIQPV